MAETVSRMPDGFLWGAATSAYQIEGAVTEDGRGVSIWDTFSATPGKVLNDNTGEMACDHYHRWREDVDIMRQLNLSAYRFSTAWPRILPLGRGEVNQKGLDFYSRLVDALLAANITPFITLYHWDLPQPLEDIGGWQRRGIADDFANYTDVVSRALGDRVKHWITFNEPWLLTWLGYVMGLHAPGYKSDTPAPALAASHHAYLAHGAAVNVLRQNVPDAQVGIALNIVAVDPATAKPSDLAATARFDGYHHRWYLDPLFRGHYPADIVDYFQPYMPEIHPGDMAQIQTPIDFLGINYYAHELVADGGTNAINTSQTVPDDERTDQGTQVYPEGLYRILKRLHTDYNPRAIYVTENGAVYNDEISPDGQVHDEARVRYLKRHFEAAALAASEGVPLKGYFVWSLLDNFEWAEGYSRRFGMTYVDYTTQRRIIKDSGRYFAGVAKTNQI